MTGPMPDFHSDPLFQGTCANFLQHHVCLNENGVSMQEISWCQKNCEGKWGWLFKSSDIDPDRWQAYMSFENTQDALKFKLNLI